MFGTARSLVSGIALSCFGWFLGGCQDGFERRQPDNSGGAGTGGQSGSSGTGGLPSSGGGIGCYYEGTAYDDGSFFGTNTLCVSCSCKHGEVECGLHLGEDQNLDDCEEHCRYDYIPYHLGDTFRARDGCNTCTCNAGWQVSCTDIDCTDCWNKARTYNEAMEQAKACDPTEPDQCSKLLVKGLTCGCETFVNPANATAILAVQAAEASYAATSCGEPPACGACQPAVSSRCSAAGRCEVVADTGQGAACKVGGIVYPSGSKGIGDPTSCNTCNCTDGQLSCTEINCPIACPPDTTYGTQCAGCGPTDACKIVEHACLPACVDTCTFGACIGGICKNLCG